MTLLEEKKVNIPTHARARTMSVKSLRKAPKIVRIILPHLPSLLETRTFSIERSTVTMAATELHEEEMKKKCQRQATDAKEPLEKLRLCLLSKGASGIKGLSRSAYVALALFNII